MAAVLVGDELSLPIEIFSHGFGLPEGPVYDRDTEELYVCDATGGGVWRVPIDGSARTAVVPHRKGIAGLALHADGGFIVGGRNVAWKRGEETIELAQIDLDGPGVRFNDLTVSPEGRVYAGSIDLERVRVDPTAVGSLMMIDLDGTVAIVAGDVQQTNGMGCSPDGTTLYHVDTGPKILRSYRFAPDGSLSPWDAFYTWPSGVPDGMAVAADGSVWVAVGDDRDAPSGVGFIDVIEPDGSLRDRIEVLASVKSLCFGDADLQTVYVVAGGGGIDGVVGRFRSDIPGRPVPRARVRPRAAGA